MYYMIINNFNTSTLSNCYVTDFGKAQTATPRATEKVVIHGANGSESIHDGAYESYERTCLNLRKEVLFRVNKQTI